MFRLLLLRLIFLPFLLTNFVAVTQAQKQAEESPESRWTQFRGTDGTGVADSQATPPTKIDLDHQTAWEVEIPGTGWSSPVYQGNRIWLTTAVTQAATDKEIADKLKGDRLAQIKTLAQSMELKAVCVDARDGQILLSIPLAKIDSPEPINPMNSYASPTPAIDEGKVVCHFGNYGTWCLDEATGKTIWSKQFVVKHSVGPGSSPVIFGDKVIIVCDGTDKQFIVGVDLNSGDQVWKTDRPPIRASDGEFRKAYCTPLLIDVDGAKQAVIPGAQWVAGYNPDTGAELWRAEHGDGFSVTPMPIFESGLVVFSTGFMKPELVAVDPRGSGDVTSSHIAWRVRNAPTMPSFIAQGGQIFSISDKGILMCVDAKTGEVVNRQRVGGNYSASPLLAGGNLYFSSREGIMTVIKCSADLETVAKNEFESSLMASPILIGDDLLIRTEKKLIRVNNSQP